MPAFDLPLVAAAAPPEDIVFDPSVDTMAPPTLVGRLFEGQAFVDVEGATGPVRVLHVLFFEIELAYSAVPVTRLTLSPLTVLPGEGVVVAECQDANGNWWRGAARPITRIAPSDWEPPRIAYQPQAGATLVRVTRVGAGARVLVVRDGTDAYGVADPDGVARVIFETPLEADDELQAIATYDSSPLGSGSDDFVSEVVSVDRAQSFWPSPEVESTIFGGQTHVAVGRMRVGFPVFLERNGNGPIDNGPARDREGWIALPFTVQGGDEVEIWQASATAESDRLSFAVVTGTDKPRVVGVVANGIRTLRIEGQVPGHELRIVVGFRRWLRPAGLQLEVDIGEPVDGAAVTVTQVGPRTEATSDVQSAFDAPLTTPQVLEGFAETTTAIVALMNPGLMAALYRIEAAATPVLLGIGWAGNRGSAVIDVFPMLQAGQELQALVYQDEENLSGWSSAVEVQPVPDELPTAVVLPPAYRGDDRVVVAGNLMGAHVSIEATSDGVEWSSLGGHILPDPHGTVLIDPIPDDTIEVRAVCTVGDRAPVTGDALRVVDDPGTEGPHVPAQVDIFDAAGQVQGRFFFPYLFGPATPDFSDPDAALLVIIHGEAPSSWEPSYQGYDWLGLHLASRGMFVYAIRNIGALGAIASDTEALDPALAALEAQYPELVGRGLFLMGHSQGWNVVVSWTEQHRQGDAGHPMGLIGYGAAVVGNEAALAPATMMVAGTLDAYEPLNDILGFRSESHGQLVTALIEGMNHQGWNSEWAAQAKAISALANPLSPDTDVWNEGSISETAHQKVGKALVTAFVRFVSDIDGWWRCFGVNQPPAMRAHRSRLFLERSPVPSGCNLVPIHVALEPTSFPASNTNAMGLRVPEEPFTTTDYFVNGIPVLSWDMAGDTVATEDLVFTGNEPRRRTDLILNGSSWSDDLSSLEVPSLDLLVEFTTAARSTFVRFEQLPFPAPLFLEFTRDAASIRKKPGGQLVSVSLRATRGSDPGFRPGNLTSVRLHCAREAGVAAFSSLELWCTS